MIYGRHFLWPSLLWPSMTIEWPSLFTLWPSMLLI